MTGAIGPVRRPALWWVLLRLEARLTFRDVGGGRRGPGAKPKKPAASSVGRKRLWFVYGGIALLFHAIGFALAYFAPRQWPDTQGSRLATCAVLLFVFTLMLSMAMSRIVAAFHERRDLDLLLAAPIPPHLILVVRALTVVAAVSATFAFFVFPIVDMGLVLGRWWMARLYLLLPLMALLATAFALALTGAVVRIVGVRRARVGLQIFSALVGASMYLLSQAQQFLPKDVSHRAMSTLMRWTRDDDLAWPVAIAARLAAGDPVVWLMFASLSVTLFAAAVWSARRRFFEVAQTPEANARVVAPERQAVERRIGGGFARGLFAALLVKEWKLLLRAPQLLSQILLQLLYLMPLLFVALSRGGTSLSWSASAFAAGVVGVAGTLATSLAWLTVSAEDAPDLLAGSPRTRGTIVGAKLFAAALPPVVVVVLAALGIAQRAAYDASVVLVYGVLACVSAAILAASSTSAGKRGDFQRRHQGNKLAALVEAVQFLLWGAAAGTAVAGLWWVAAATTALALILPGIRLPRALRLNG